MFNQYRHYWLANTDTAALLLHQRHATEQCVAECVFFVLQKLGYFPLGCCPKLLRKFRHGKWIALSTKLVIVVVDGHVC